MESKGGGSLEKKPLDGDSDSARTSAADESATASDSNSTCTPVTENISEPDGLREEAVLENPNGRSEGDSLVLSKTNPKACAEPVELLLKSPGSLSNGDGSSDGKSPPTKDESSDAVVKSSKPLCADYRSASDSESVDSESDSPESSGGASETCRSFADESEAEEGSSRSGRGRREGKAEGELGLSELPPIEELKISVPENACVEVGQISSVVETLVVVESYKGTAALDVDTVLFLDCGRRSLGKVFDILGPITEPVYTVRFNNEEQIRALGIEKGQRVYYAPKTQHTMFVFLSEILKNKGSDASWKDNVEAPSEFQDFSDDEEERLHKNKQKRESAAENGCAKEGNQSRKRSFSRTKQSPGILQPSRFRHPGVSAQRRPHSPRQPAPHHFAPPPAFSAPPHFPAPLPYAPPPYPPPHIYTPAPPPPIYHPPSFSAPPFPAFSPLPRPFHPPFFHHSTHAFPPSAPGPWPTPLLGPPPPPPPPGAQLRRASPEPPPSFQSLQARSGDAPHQ